MRTSDSGRAALAVSEGIVVTPYLDSVNVWTVGIGHTANAGHPDPSRYKGKEYSMSEIFDLFDKDIRQYEDAVNKYINISLRQHEFDALVHFTYNVGPGGLSRSNLRRWLNVGDRKTAFSKGFHGWLKPRSLLSRRDKERDMALYARYGSMKAPIYTVNSGYRPKYLKTTDLAKNFPSQKPAGGISGGKMTSDPSEPQNLLAALLSLFKWIFGNRS